MFRFCCLIVSVVAFAAIPVLAPLVVPVAVALGSLTFVLALPAAGRSPRPPALSRVEQTPLEWAYAEFARDYDDDFVKAITDLERHVEEIENGRDPRPVGEEVYAKAIVDQHRGYPRRDRAADALRSRREGHVAAALAQVGPVGAAVAAMEVSGLAAGHAEITQEHYRVEQSLGPVAGERSLVMGWRDIRAVVLLPLYPGQSRDATHLRYAAAKLLDAAESIADHRDTPGPLEIVR